LVGAKCENATVTSLIQLSANVSEID